MSLPSERKDVENLVSNNRQDIEEMIHILGAAVPMVGELHILEVRMWDDRLNSFRQFLRDLIQEV